ncbi:MAG: hypothetical protein ACJAQW_001853 [Paracoccaceae bacterium]|jgi:uncharacterized protein YhaN
MMRLRQLTLDFFGGFTGRGYDFGPRRAVGTPDFHVIYGPNEAGKTTTMEAYLRLLYGFPHREQYDFLHQRKNLRVSGLLDIDGTETAFARLPTRDGSLRDVHGAVVPDAALQSRLSGLSQEDYRSLLCLDDVTIEKGGEEITQAKGDIGRLLFSAAAGISDLSVVLDGVRVQADEIYRKRANKTRLAVLKKEHTEVERQIRAIDVPASQYRRLKQAVDEAHAQQTHVSAQRKTFFAAKAALEARLKALPLLGKIDALEERLAAFAAWPAQLDIDPEGLVRMLTEQARAQGHAKKLVAERDMLRTELAAVEQHPAHLALAQTLDDLDGLRSRYATADLDLDRRQAKLAQERADMRLLVSDLGAPEGCDPEGLVLSSAVVSQLEQAREGLRDARQRVSAAHAEVVDLDQKIEAATAAQRALATGVPDEVDFAGILARFDVDTLLSRYAAAHEAVKTGRRNARVALDGLTIKGQGFDVLPSCRVTLEEAETLVACLKDVTRRHEVAVGDLDDTRVELAGRSARIAQIKSMEGLIDDEEARILRAERDGLWEAHKTRLNAQTAEGFEGAMVRVDGATDLRLSYAADLGTLRQHEQDLAAFEARADLAQQQIAHLAGSLENAQSRLLDAVREAGIDAPVAPEAFVIWLAKHETAAQARADLRRLEDTHRETFDRAHRLTEVLSTHIPRDAPEFADLVGVAKTGLAAQRTRQENLRTATARVDDLNEERAKRAARCTELEDTANAARRDWLAQVAGALPAGLNTDLLENSVQLLHEMRTHEKARVTSQRQVSAMEADQAQFREKVRELVEKVGGAITDAPLADYNALRAMAQNASDAQGRSANLMARIDVLEQDLDKTQKGLDDIDIEVHEMAGLFPEGIDTGSLSALRQTVSTASEVIADRARREELVGDLLSFLDLANQNEARAMLVGATQAGLHAQLAEVSTDLEDIEKLFKRAIETRTTAEQEVRAIGGDSDVAQHVERKATLELEMQDEALRHLELSLGHRLAEAAIRRYRDEHRSTMMQATETAFAKLTNGAYCQLQTQIDGASETLLALDAQGKAKQAQDMSKGTRFQLYLALRAAAYEQLADQGTSLPFFCDDIFETFDEDRTRSACRVMEQVGRRGQAIYLTHHQHVVDIARDVCGGGVQIHTIGE